MLKICQRFGLVAMATIVLSACGSTSKGDIDPGLTGSVETPAIDQTQNSDANIIRNAVSAVNLEAPGSLPLSWANRDTGSSGMISTVTEKSDDGQVCRRFETSRESYEGVSLYTGHTCLDANGQWFMQEFAAI